MGSTSKQWTRQSVKNKAMTTIPKALLMRFHDYYNRTQGPAYTDNMKKSEAMELSIENNPETFIEHPETNRWKTEDGKATTTDTGKDHFTIPSTAVESIIVDKNTKKEDRVKVSISFTTNPTKYYDYWATEAEIEGLMNASSKGLHVARYWNHNSEKHYD